MFPIRSARGQVIGFGGRVLDSGEPKYLNSPETPMFRKGHELYGLYEARQELRAGRNKSSSSKGYLDVASLVQFGVEYVVATLGTAMTAENMQAPVAAHGPRGVLLRRRCAPAAPPRARAMEAALPFGGGSVDIRFLLLPEKDDPDTFVRSQGADAFRALAAGAIALPDFFVDELDKRVDFKSTGGRGRFDVSAKPLRRLPEGSYRETVLDALRGNMGPRVGRVREADGRTRRQFVVEQARPAQGGWRQAQDRRAKGHQPGPALPARGRARRGAPSSWPR